MSLLRLGGPCTFALEVLLAYSCLLNATSASPTSPAVFDSSLLKHAVGPVACKQPCTDASIQGGFDGIAADVDPAATSALSSVGVPVSYDSAAILNPESSPAESEDDGILHVDPRWGMKRFLLIALLLGGLVRFFTSATYRKFICDVLDPLSF
jgi:hypothetical protein